MVGPTELAVAVSAGLATFFAPCAAALLPGYVGYTAHRTNGTETLPTTVLRGFAAGGGSLLMLAGILLLLQPLGHRVLDGVAIVEPGVGLILIGVGGLLLLGRFPSITIPLPARPASLSGFALFGAGYALAAVGCVLPVFVGLVSVASTATTSGALLIGGLYIGIVVSCMVAATIAAGVGAEALLERVPSRTRLVERLAGLVILLAGAGQLWIAL